MTSFWTSEYGGMYPWQRGIARHLDELGRDGTLARCAIIWELPILTTASGSAVARPTEAAIRRACQVACEEALRR